MVLYMAGLCFDSPVSGRLDHSGSSLKQWRFPCILVALAGSTGLFCRGWSTVRHYPGADPETRLAARLVDYIAFPGRNWLVCDSSVERRIAAGWRGSSLRFRTMDGHELSDIGWYCYSLYPTKEAVGEAGFVVDCRPCYPDDDGSRQQGEYRAVQYHCPGAGWTDCPSGSCNSGTKDSTW